MNYIYGTFNILRNKFFDFLLFNGNVPRIKPKLPLYLQYSYFYSGCSDILDGLYLGSSFNAYNLNDIKSKNIKIIINITNEIDNFHESNLLLHYYKFPIRDNNDDDIVEILMNTYDIIDYHMNKGENILVHCYMGASRSASVIIHYLMKKHRWSYERSKNYVIEKRPIVNLSEKFDKVLKQLNYIYNL